MELITNINNAINGFVWGLPMLVLLMGAGLFLSLRTGFVQFRKFGHAMKTPSARFSRKPRPRQVR